MQSSGLLLVLLVCLGSYGAMSAENFTAYMGDYLIQNQRQYDAKLKELNDEINLVRSTFSSGLRGISIQADQIEAKLEEVKARLDPMELIDSWQKQCVRNYSTSIPLIATVLNTINTCSSFAQSNLNSILWSAQNSYNSLQNYYKNSLKTMLTDCTKKNPDSLSNYTICITQAIAETNTYTINTQKNFNTYIQQAKCSADMRMNDAWECAFARVYDTGATVGTALRLIDDCIANQLTCASVSCTTGCNNHMVLGMNERDFLNDTIRNPFIGLNSKLGCMEVLFKN